MFNTVWDKHILRKKNVLDLILTADTTN
uniref:Uncharacterized protein n=1 Tax=Anguilla anguilla TaxID=7936 RepID=A0A0E9QCM1_ANGAN